MNIPGRQQSTQVIREAEALNPGSWVAHSFNVAQAAQNLAQALCRCGYNLVPDRAYTLGLLHDIGRRDGVSDMRHIIDGYRFLHEQGFEDAARICLTHSFPLQDVTCMGGNWDGSPEDYTFVAGYLEQAEYTPYDRLIQLCDAIALPEGFCLIEKRMVEVALRRGINQRTLDKWRAFFAVKRRFELALGEPIYTYLPGVVETTFQQS